jgi:hypothetical protein
MPVSGKYPTRLLTRLSFFIVLGLVFGSFTSDEDSSQYIIPRAGMSICASDIDLDGDVDLVTGHKTVWGNINASIGVLENLSNFGFTVIDTSWSYCGSQSHIFAMNVNYNDFPDLVTFYSDFSSGNADRYIRILWNNSADFDSVSDISLNSSATFNYINYGDFNGDGFMDLVVTSNQGQFWGVLYNNELGSFFPPVYYLTPDYFPSSAACGDLNNDGREDIVICGQSVEVFFSLDTGFEKLILEQNSYRSDVEITDFDNDGDADIITAGGVIIGGSTRVLMYENIGNKEFDTILPEIWFQPLSYNFSVADFNNDSLPDLLFYRGDNIGHILYYNLGNFILGDSTHINISDGNAVLSNACCADLDGNGYQDIASLLALTYFEPSILDIRYNDGSGHFGADPYVGVPVNSKQTESPFLAYPNPFATEINFKFKIHKESFVELMLYNLEGKLVSCVLSKPMPGGSHTIEWKGTDQSGNPLPPGVYLLSARTNGFHYASVKVIKN